jgi:uncharacterized protein DUF3179
MLSKLCPAVALLLFLLSSALPAAQEGSTREVVTERKRRLIPGGPGQEPFDVTRHTIPINEIQAGGPPRDAIAALVNPKFESVAVANRFLKKSERVLGVIFNGQAKAYSIRVLNWHELVNDFVGGRPVLVSW